MTPARKKALEYFDMNREVGCKIADESGPATPKMIGILMREGLLETYKAKRTPVYNLTDAGRRALNGDSK